MNNLLIIDDETDVLEIVGEYMGTNGFSIGLANTRDDILENLELQIQKKQFDIIICDIEMPEIKGDEVLKLFRSKKIETPFIFYTGHYRDVFKKNVIKLGTFDIINKPDSQGLLDSVIKCLEHRSLIQTLTKNSIIGAYEIETLLCEKIKLNT